MVKANIFAINIPVYVCVAVTNKCMLDCVYCYCEEETLPDMSTQELKGLIDEMAIAGCSIIWFSGGEPLLRDDIIEIAGYAKDKELSVRVFSNGNLLYEKREILGIIDQLSISLDGPEEMHDANRGAGSFKKAMQAIEIASNKTVLWTNTVLSKYNTGCIDFILEKARQYSFGANFSVVRDPRYVCEDGEDYRKIYKRLIIEKKKGAPICQSLECLKTLLAWPDYRETIYKKNDLELRQKCLAGKMNCYVNYDGNVYPCCHLIGKADHGNVLKVGFDHAFNNICGNGGFKCGMCSNPDYIESNLLYSLNIGVVVNKLKTLLAKNN